MKLFLRTLTCIGLIMGIAPGLARAADLPSATATVPVPVPFRASEDTLPRLLRDDGGAQVALRVPRSLYRDANSFRLYGSRPLTLHSRDRRRDLYRDALLELATRSRLTPAVTAWDPLARQWTWLGGQNLHLPGVADPVPVVPGTVRNGADAAARWTQELQKKIEGLPGYNQWGTLSRAIGGQALGKAGTALDLSSPVATTLQLRALATDRAEQRLRLAGKVLRLDQPGADPALQAGYTAALAEFDEVRQGLWPALAGSLQRNQGQLLVSAVKNIALSPLGVWAIFGQLAWQGAESVVNAEYNGQYAIILGMLACTLEDPASAAADPDIRGAALYLEYAMNGLLKETFQNTQLLALKPAGGLTTQAWQIQFSSRCEELKRALNPG